ncbi:hypothetical protein ACQPZF_36250 [Actinosynnema sp. CS-041913]|uniref:hypothetical protein n=1 Tax=Actinosynnema sp. CS-041913 TaxID=3239917 RepID=UPI003D8C5275
MKRTVDADALNLARQLRRCEEVLDCGAEIDRFFYELPGPVDDLMALAVRGAGGSSHHDGGWDDLAAVLPAARHGFEAIVCARVDRLSRISSRFLWVRECDYASATAILPRPRRCACG